MNRFLIVLALSMVLFSGCYTQYAYRYENYEDSQDSTLVEGVAPSVDNDYLNPVNKWVWWDSYWARGYFFNDYRWRYPWMYNSPHYLNDYWYWGWRDWNMHPYYYRPHIYFGFRFNLGSHNYIRHPHRYYTPRPIIHQSLRADNRRPEYRRYVEPRVYRNVERPHVYGRTRTDTRIEPRFNHDYNRPAPSYIQPNRPSYNGNREMNRQPSRESGRSSPPANSYGERGGRSRR